MVTLRTSDPCGVCGYLREGFSIPSMRVNKRSMRSYGTTLMVLPGRCRECGAVSGVPPRLTWRLDPESAARVEAYRLKRWPELAVEVCGTGYGFQRHLDVGEEPCERCAEAFDELVAAGVVRQVSP